MDQEQLRALFEQVRQGQLDIESAMTRMKHMPFEDLGFAKVDHHRALRHGMPEVIFAKGKTPDQVIARMLAVSDAFSAMERRIAAIADALAQTRSMPVGDASGFETAMKSLTARRGTIPATGSSCAA